MIIDISKSTAFHDEGRVPSMFTEISYNNIITVYQCKFPPSLFFFFF